MEKVYKCECGGEMNVIIHFEIPSLEFLLGRRKTPRKITLFQCEKCKKVDVRDIVIEMPSKSTVDDIERVREVLKYV